MKSIIALVAVAGVAGAANADDILSYAGANDFGAGSAPLSAAAGITGNNLFAGAGVDSTSFSTFNYTSWDAATLADAVAQDEYFSWGFNVDAGFSVNLEDFDIRYDRSGSGPDDVAIYLWEGSLGASTLVHSFDFNDATTGVTQTNIDLSSLTGLTGTVEFRLYAWASESSGGTFDLESFAFPTDPRAIQVRGDIVPAPGAAALLAMGGLVATRRRR